MAESTVQRVLCGGNYGAMLNAINDAEEYLNRKEVKFPQLVVFGDESAGKSSLMEAICKAPLPKGGQITTRAVINVRLRRGPRKMRVWTTTKYVGERRNEREIKYEEELGDVIAEIQREEIEEQNEDLPPDQRREFLEDPITIEIFDENNPDLTLVDLPGFFQNSSNDESKVSSEDISFIREVLLDYLRDSSSILLIVVSANVNVKTVNILNFIGSFEQDLTEEEKTDLRERTIYCLTKCDLVDGKPGKQEPPQDIKKLMNNEGHVKAVPHGWYAVVNNLSGLDSKRREKLVRDREDEKKFFEHTEPYTMFKDRCGIPNLVLKLTTVLENEIMQSIPRISPLLDMKISSFKEERDALGPATRGPDYDRGLDEIVRDVVEFFREATNGETLALRQEGEKNSSDLSNEDYQRCELARLRKERIEVFKRAIHNLRPPLDGTAGERLEKFKKLVEKMMGIAVDGVVEKVLPNKTVIENVLREMAMQWRRLAEEMYREIAERAKACLEVIIWVRVGQYKNLSKIMSQLANNIIEEQKNFALTRLKWHYVDEVGRPDTLNEQFPEKFAALKPAGLSHQVGKTRDTYIDLFTAIFPVIENRFIDNAVRTLTTHIFDVPVNHPRIRNESANAFDHKFTSFDVHQLLPKGVQNLDKEAVDNHLFELTDDRGRKREVLQNKIEKLETLRSVLDYKPSAFREPKPFVDDASIITSITSANGVNGMQSHLYGYED